MDSTNNEAAASLVTTEPSLTLPQVEERLLQLVSSGNSHSYQIGKLYHYVVDKQLALTGGFKDAQDFFKQRIQTLSQSSLSMYSAVALKFSEPTSLKYGMEKLYMLLTYARRASLQVDGNEPGPTPINVPREDGEVVPKPFSECSREDMKLAAKHQRSPNPSVSDLDAARVKRLQDTLDRSLPEKHGIRVMARRENGELRLTLKNVPENAMEQLVAALLGTPPQPTSAPLPQGVPHAPTQQAAVAARPQVAPPPSMVPPSHPGGARNTGTGLRSLLRQAFQRPPIS